MKLQVLEMVFCLFVCVAAERLLLLHRVVDGWLHCLGRVGYNLHYWDRAELKTDGAVPSLIRRFYAEMRVTRMDMVLFCFVTIL